MCGGSLGPGTAKEGPAEFLENGWAMGWNPLWGVPVTQSLVFLALWIAAWASTVLPPSLTEEIVLLGFPSGGPKLPCQMQPESSWHARMQAPKGGNPGKQEAWSGLGKLPLYLFPSGPASYIISRT
jgi:hypothetical protein